ncbi:MAG: CPBP family intramembrane glutamic endopeptidase [Terriglobales bacterium]
MAPSYRSYFTWFQLIAVYVLLEGALWSSRMSVRNLWALAIAIAVFAFVLLDGQSIREMGLGLPTAAGAGLALAVSLAAAIFLILMVHRAGGEIPADAVWPDFKQSSGYLLWALIQEFLLQSFFFTRCEKLFGGADAVWVAATLFAAAHLPNPILTTSTFVAALVFCELFRRYRSIYPLAIAHAALGLTVAATMPDSVLHHMRVGMGYLRY